LRGITDFKPHIMKALGHSARVVYRNRAQSH